MRLATGFILFWVADLAIAVGFGAHIWRWEMFISLGVIAFLALCNGYSWHQYLAAKERIARDWKERLDLEAELRRLQ